MAAVGAGDWRAAAFLLRTRGRHRGYALAMTITPPPPAEHKRDYSGMSADELRSGVAVLQNMKDRLDRGEQLSEAEIAAIVTGEMVH